MKTKSPSPRIQATRQRLLEAAGRQLLSKGYAGATTRSIAEAAGVSELTLFRHFPTKRELFSALFNTYAPVAGIQMALSSPLTGDVRQDLLIISHQVFSMMIERREAMLLTFSEAEGLEELREIVAQLPRQGRQMLAFYLQMQMSQGNLRQCDSALAAQALIGMFLSYIVTQSMLKEPIDESDTLVQTFVDIFLNGMLPLAQKS